MTFIRLFMQYLKVFNEHVLGKIMGIEIIWYYFLFIAKKEYAQHLQ